MNGLLLDTHIFLWYVTQDSRLISEVERRIDEAPLVQLSVVSAWEIAIKVGLGKLRLDRPLAELIGPVLSEKNIELLSISEADVHAYAELAFPDPKHRDPFDRMLLVQAAERGQTLLTSDPALVAYGNFVSAV